MSGIEPTSLSQLSEEDRERMRLRDQDRIQVCASCMTVACHNSDVGSCRERAHRVLKTVEVPIGTLRELGKEHPSHWITLRISEGYDLPEQLAITRERLSEIEERCRAVAENDPPPWFAVPCRVRVEAAGSDITRPDPLHPEGRWVICPVTDYERLPTVVVDYADSEPLEWRLYAESVARFVAEAGADVPDLARELRASWEREARLQARIAELEAGRNS